MKPFSSRCSRRPHNLVHDWYIFIHYLLLTVYGFLLASMPGAWDWIRPRSDACRLRRVSW